MQEKPVGVYAMLLRRRQVATDHLFIRNADAPEMMHLLMRGRCGDLSDLSTLIRLDGTMSQTEQNAYLIQKT
ncbi:hypothetical protein M514_12094 [Trichuris suis]|uniref:Uncharacterized protein n=1 Tax=Trichuris suis TaxID=68888 RepID=A0A085LPW6_9BILA|nr:hypothetical protein M513_12094 [Trichuris suis]KFD61039.1 hypothetical protein M514_12094 [Trichuris suis]